MSGDDTTHDVPVEEFGAKKESDFDREQKRGPVQPDNEELFNFLDELFSGDGEFPESIDVFLAKGRNRDQVAFMLKRFQFKSGSHKPTREKLVAMCNEIVRRTKVYTDTLRREATFMVGALNHARGADHYDILPVTVKPSRKYRNGEMGVDGGGGDDDEEFSSRYNNRLLEHFTTFFGLIGGMMEGLIDRSDRQAAAAMANADRAYARTIELLESNISLVRSDWEMKERMEKSRMWRENVSKGVDLAWKILPPMLTGFRSGNTGGWSPGAETEEARTIRQYFTTSDEGGPLTRDQFQLIFGQLEGGRVVAPGVLTLEQGRLLADIASLTANPDTLDLLLPGGALELTQEQFMKIVEAGVPLDIFLPLKALMDVRMAKQKAAQQPQTK